MASLGTLLRSRWKILLCYLFVFQLVFTTITVNAKSDDDTLETECRPFVEKALKDQLSRGVDSSGSPESAETGEPPNAEAEPSSPNLDDNQSDVTTTSNEESQENTAVELDDATISTEENSQEKVSQGQDASQSLEVEQADQPQSSEEAVESQDSLENVQSDAPAEEVSDESSETVVDTQSVEAADDNVAVESKEDEATATDDTTESKSIEETVETETTPEESSEQPTQGEESTETQESLEQTQPDELPDNTKESQEETVESEASVEDTEAQKSQELTEDAQSTETVAEETVETTESVETVEATEEPTVEVVEATETETTESAETTEQSKETEETTEPEVAESSPEDVIESDQQELAEKVESAESEAEPAVEPTEETEASPESEEEQKSSEDANENDLIKEFEIPENLRPRDTIVDILHLDEESSENELALAKAADNTLRELKRLYDSAIKPLEILYKYRDLSNRHFGDPEIFSKPLILFMGPWSGGKSSIINYLLDNDYKETSLKTGAEPSPAYFNIVMWGAEPEVLDGTQLAADWTFSGLQKFGQGLEDRLRGLKLPHKLLEMVNIVEIPGILEVRKQVSRVFPFNDACQWFIDRADVIFLVYDPSKLDVGPETEAILDQLKGREYQTRVILNKADTVKPEELLRVQGALIWNISPLMSSPQPPIIYTTSLWSTPYNPSSPVRLLQAQEKAFLRDIRQAIDRRVENKISSARRFAVRVRNHAKMVDCYLTTYYNHKTFFGNRKQIADEIIEKPQDYHIYEGLSTLKNISRYDLPDPDAYRDFFKINPLYEFQPLSATCTYFKGCPINRLDICIAYDLPELVGKHKKAVDQFIGKTQSNS